MRYCPKQHQTKSALQKYMAMRFFSVPEGICRAAAPGVGKLRQDGVDRRWSVNFVGAAQLRPKTRKSLLSVATTGFFDILRGYCTVVVKWWSIGGVIFFQLCKSCCYTLMNSQKDLPLRVFSATMAMKDNGLHTEELADDQAWPSSRILLKSVQGSVPIL